METSPHYPGRIAFDHFELDPRSGELWKNGHRIRLQPRPFQLLTMLLKRQGEVVTREEVCSKLWPSDTFVDFDHGLAMAVNKVREALGDSAECPRFVETLPRRGYRFIGKIRPPAVSEIPEPYTPMPPAKPAPYGWKAAWIIGAIAALSIAYVWQSRRSHAAASLLQPVLFTAYTGLEVVPSFSPDGSRISFSLAPDARWSDGFDLYVKDIGSESPIRLTHQPSRWLSSAWSPDGTQIAIHRVSKNDSGIFLVPAIGGAERKLRSTFAANSTAAAISWAPDGQSLAFADSPSPEGLRRLSILSLGSLETTQIPHDETCKEEQIPAFSHDGKRLAYICSLGWEEYGVAVLNRIEGKVRILKTFRGWAHGIVWTGDDNALIFSESQIGDEHPGLRELRVADAVVRPLEYGRPGEWPAISSKGDRFAYDNYEDGHNLIWRLDLENLQNPPIELISSTQEQFVAQYSPDGGHVAFASSRTGNNEIWMSDADGKELVQLTNLGDTSGSPSWSPDSKKLVFDSRHNGRSNIYVMDVQERVPRRIVLNVEQPSVPSWSRNGRWIYFIAGAGTNGAKVYRASPEGGDATALSTSSGYGPVESFDGERVYFAIHDGKRAVLYSASLKPTGTEIPVKGIPELSFVANWAVVREGVYFYPADAPGTLSYFDFAKQQVRPVYEVGRGSFYGLSISPDGRYAIYAKMDGATSDIMLINHFR